MALAPVYKGAPTPAYKITKAALNMLTVQYAQDYASEGFTFLSVSPGVSVFHFIYHPLFFFSGKTLIPSPYSGSKQI